MEKDEQPDSYFVLTNSSNEDIFIHSKISNNTVGLDYFPASPTDIVSVGKKYNQPISNISFKDGNKLWILVYKQSTLDSHTWQEIKDQGLYDKRYDFTLEQLKAINYEIVYTGN
ncbi:hypothetical protein [Flavobacterium marginilacus]|nr:hypothetical protein [Flavobacterium marginilacus]